jgi:hypothetical protein
LEGIRRQRVREDRVGDERRRRDGRTMKAAVRLQLNTWRLPWGGLG